MKSKKTGSLRQPNLKKLKRTKTSLAVRRALSEQDYERIIKNRLGGMPTTSLNPCMSDVRVTHVARYKLSRWQRIKNWFRNVFGRRSSYPEY